MDGFFVDDTLITYTFLFTTKINNLFNKTNMDYSISSTKKVTLSMILLINHQKKSCKIQKKIYIFVEQKFILKIILFIYKANEKQLQVNKSNKDYEIY